MTYGQSDKEYICSVEGSRREDVAERAEDHRCWDVQPKLPRCEGKKGRQRWSDERYFHKTTSKGEGGREEGRTYGMMYEKIASDLTPEIVFTQAAKQASSLEFCEMLAYRLERIEIRTARQTGGG
jgi:hypothetical protein